MCSWEDVKDPGSHLEPCALFLSHPLETLSAGGRGSVWGSRMLVPSSQLFASALAGAGSPVPGHWPLGLG